MKLLFSGYCLLISAVLLNWLATIVHITTWYQFLSLPTTIQDLQLFDYLFLFFLYPFLLGLVAYLTNRYLHK